MMKKTVILMVFSLIMIFYNCKSDKGDKAQLTANEWQLKEMVTTNGKVQLPRQVPVLVLTDTNMVYGFSGCNRLFGKYSTEGSAFKYSFLGGTRMSCPDMSIEKMFLKTLDQMTTYSIKNKELKLTDKDKKQSMVFTPRESGQELE